jgi:CHAD domain-containing protein
MLASDPALRLGAAGADVHAFRVATRRLRSDLRTFRPLLEPDWVAALRSELSWIADVVGAVRDADVLGDRLRAQAADLGEGDAPDDVSAADSSGVASLLRLVTEQGAAARAALLDALRSARYDALIESLVAASSHPAFAGAAEVDAPARTVVARLVRRTWKRLRREVRVAGKNPTDHALHRVRIVAKRSRYAAEAAARVFGRRAERFAEAITDVQTVLGDHHDASVAEQWLRAAASSPGAAARAGLAAGMLIARQRRDREHLHRKWRRVWKKASRKELRRWF